MKKGLIRIISCLLVVIMLLTAAPLGEVVGLELGLSASAVSYSGTCGEDGDNLTWSLDTETGELSITGSGEMEDYHYVDGIYFSYPGTPWYSYRIYIRTVTIESGVTSIGNYAFCGCSYLKSVTIPNSVTSIGDYAFSGCGILTNVTIPNSVTSIGSSAFYCLNLKNVYYADSRDKWNSINFGSSNDYLLNAAIHFDYGTQPHDFTSEVIEPANCFFESGVMSYTCSCGVAYTGKIDHNDSDNDGICDVCNLGVSVIFIGKGTCGENISWALGDEGTLLIRGEGAMYDYNYDTPFYYDVGEGSVGGFYPKIRSVIIESGVTTIGERIFYNCTNLTSVIIPDSVTNIAVSAFDSTILYDNEANWENGVLYIDNCLIEAKSTVSGDYIVKDGTRFIVNDAFSYCSSLSSITIPDSVITIGESAFYSCENLASAMIGNGVTSIGGAAFRHCSSLKSITIPDSVITIGESAFYSCENLTSATIGNGVTSIGGAAFRHCSSLKSITVDPANTCYLSDECGVLFDKDVTELIQYPVARAQESYVIPDGVKSISDYAFYKCYKTLTSITIPNRVTKIGDYAFGECYSLKNVYYKGSRDQWIEIDFGSNNNYLFGAAIQYDYGTHNHSYTSKVTKAATCTATGVKTYTCSVCGDTYTETIKALDHDYSTSWTIDKVATCTAAGSKSYHCTRCDAKTDVTEIEKNDHVASGWITDKEASCINEGSRHKECVNCNETLTTEKIATTEHVSSNWITDREPDCTNSGLRHTECTTCGQYLQTYQSDPNGHIFNTVVNLATCTTGGSVIRTCTVCGETETEELAPYDHNFSTSWTIDQPATCLVTGIKSRHCTRCDEKTDVTVIEKTDHVASGWITDKAATCINEGTRHKECIYCNETLSTEAIATTAHTSSNWITDRNPGCTNPGLRHTECTVCGEYLKTSAPEAIGHTFHTVVKVAMCTVNGSVIRTCTACGKVETEVIPAFGHNYVKKVTAPTCLKDGYTTHTCSICGESYKDTVVKAKGSHTFSAWKTTKVATYTAAGTQTRTCSACGAAETKAIAKLKTTAISKCTSSVTASVTYTGKALSPTVTVKDGKTTLKQGTHYTVKYSNNKNIGTATVTITGVEKNGYSGTKKLTFNIVPAKPALKATAGSKKATLNWEKVTGATGYVVYMATSKDGSYKKVTTIKKAATVKYTKTGLTKGKTYYFKVRAYKTVDGKNVYSAYSSVKSVKVK